MNWQDDPIVESSAGGGWQDDPIVQSVKETPNELLSNKPTEQLQTTPYEPGVLERTGLATAPEVALQMGTGLVASAAGGLTALGTLATGGDFDLAVERLKAIQEAGTYQPRTKSGREASELINWPMEKATEGVGMLGEAAGGLISSDAAAAGKAFGEGGFQSLAVLAGKPWRAGNKSLPNDPAVLNNMLNRVVKRGFEKGIKPTGVLKTRKLIQAEAADQAAAVEAIIKGKDSLKFKDEFGDITQGKVPKDLDTLSQAIEQKKLTTFEAYNAKQLEVGKAGIEIPLDTTAAALEAFANDPVIQNHTPKAAVYANNMVEILKKQKAYSPGDAQKAMTILNQSIEAYKKNPTAENASIAGADAIQANHLRQRLNTIVDEMADSGPGYSKLKKEFGAVKSIEKAVNNRLRKYNQQSGKSALNFYEVFSASDLVQGILTGSPVVAAKGIGLHTIASAIRKAKDPNRAVKTMFQDAERIVNKMEKLASQEEAAKIVASIEPLVAEQAAQETVNLDKPTFKRNNLSPDYSEPPTPAINPYAHLFKGGLSKGKSAAGFNPYERLHQIAQSPEGKRLLVERLGREEKYTKLLDEILQIPDQLALPPGQGFQLLDNEAVYNALAQQAQGRKVFNVLGGKQIPSTVKGKITRTELQRLNALSRGLSPSNR